MPHGCLNTTDIVYDTVAEVTCHTGYMNTGNSYIRCQEDGTWSGSPMCTVVGMFMILSNEIEMK